MERQLENEYKYIKDITIDELKETISKKDLDDFKKYKENILKGDYPLMGTFDNNFSYLFAVSGNLVPENLYDFLDKLPENKKNTFTYNDLKQMGFDLIFPTENDLVKSFARKEIIVKNKLVEYFKNQKCVEPLNELFKTKEYKEYDVNCKMQALYTIKNINCPELLEILKSMHARNPINIDNIETRYLLTAFLLSLNKREREFLLPNTINDSKQLEYDLSFAFGNFLGNNIMRTLTGYTNLTSETLDSLAPHLKDKKCLEICSGTGLLAHQLQLRDIDVLPTDIADNKSNTYSPLRVDSFTDIMQIDGLKAIKKIKADVLILAWPPYDNPIAASALELFFKENPKGQILYVGEGKYGCTADDRFFDLIDELNIKVNFLNIKYKPLNGIHDSFSMLSLS